jgi:hypothetical protein
MKDFKIDLLCDELFDRPKMSFRLRELIEDYVIEHILVPNRIIVGGKWRVELHVYFDTDIDIDMDLLPPFSFIDLKLKTYPIYAYLGKINEAEDTVAAFVSCLIDCVSLFLVSNYKKVTVQQLEKLKDIVDSEAIKSIQYPASFEEQRYVRDDSPIVREMYLSKFGK